MMMDSKQEEIFLPAEWYPQCAIQLTWPDTKTDWAPILEQVTRCYINIVREISKSHKIIIVASDKSEVIKQLVLDYDERKIKIVEMPINDTWARDHGAISVFINNKPCIYDFTFNGWGNKFDAKLDNEITKNLIQSNIFQKEIQYHNHLHFVLEGGSIESDGAGTLLTTTACLLSKDRNDHLSMHEIEAYLKEIFGLKRILWLNHGYLSGDDTDSHIDTLARFCSKDSIAYVQCTDPNDEHYPELKAMEEELQQFKTMQGKPYRLIPLPMANAFYDEQNNRLPATYANFLIINNAVLMPFYGSPEKDELARKQLQLAFPEREIIGIDCLPLIWQHGSLHCITMQFPAGWV